MAYMGFTVQQKQAALATIRSEGLYAVVGEKAALRMKTAGLEKQIKDYATALKEGGVSTFEVTARYYDWEQAVGFIPEGVIRALGTQANIITLFRAIRAGVMVNVAAQGLGPLIGGRAVPVEQKEAAAEFVEYMGENLEKIAEVTGMKDYEIDRIRQDAFTIDPIDFGKAHNAIVIPAGFTPTELYNIINRGGTDGQKAFNFAEKTIKEWKSQLAAVPDVYKKHLYICATGGRNGENLEETLSVPYVNQAGLSWLIADTPEESKKRAEEARKITDKALKAKGIKE